MPLPRLVMLPGLAANSIMYEPQARAFPDMEVPPWIPNRPRETLPQYAQRLAEGIQSTGPLVLGGVSMGGMLALEMARFLKPHSVLLIASCTHPRAIRKHLILGAAATALMPSFLARPLRTPATVFSGPLLGPLGMTEKKAVVRMARTAPTNFAIWSLGAIARWKGVEDPGVPVCSIHGTADRIIPASTAKCAHLVEGAGHLVNMTHADIVNRLIERCMMEAGAPPSAEATR